MSRRSLVVLLALLATSALFMGGLGNCVQEDAFISFRYAENLIEGRGLVYNRGERVEGYTNFLWTVLLAGGMALGADPVPLSRFAGGACALGLLAVLHGMARREDAPRGTTAGWVAAALIAASPPIATEGVQGLETVFFALLVTLGVRLSIGAWRTEFDGRNPLLPAVVAGVVLALAALTRPEGVGVLGLALLASFAWRLIRRQRLVGLADRWMTGAFLLLYVPYWLWRFDYYGFPFPNTFYAKTGGGIRHLVRGLIYLGEFCRENPVLVSLTLLGLAAWGAGWNGRRRRGSSGGATPPSEASRDPFGFVLATVVLGYLGYVATVGGDFKTTFRFVIPVLPLWALGVDRSLSLLLARFPSRLRRIALAATLLAILAAGALQVPRALHWADARARDLTRRTAAGRWLGAHARPDETLAIHSAGIIPYYSRLHTIDMWGLNDLHIARRVMPEMGSGLIGHEKSDDAYVFSRRPTYYIDEFVYVTPQKVAAYEAQVVRRYAMPEIARDYRARQVPVIFEERGQRKREWFSFLELERGLVTKP